MKVMSSNGSHMHRVRDVMAGLASSPATAKAIFTLQLLACSALI